MRKIYSKVDYQENEVRVLTTESGYSLVERNHGAADSRFFTVAVCQSAKEAIRHADALVLSERSLTMKTRITKYLPIYGTAGIAQRKNRAGIALTGIFPSGTMCL